MATRPLPENYAPYTSMNALMAVLGRYRERGLPDPLTEQGLESIGVQTSMASTTLRALMFFGLMDEGGNLTEDFRLIRLASDDEYPAILGDLVRKGYVKVFTVVDPARDDKPAIENAFRVFEPFAQRGKMIQLFLGLCEESGIVSPGTVRLRKAVPSQRPRREPASVSTADRVQPSPSTAPQVVTSPPVSTPLNGRPSSETIEIKLNGFSGIVTISVTVSPGSTYLAKPDRDALLAALDSLMARSVQSEDKGVVDSNA